MSLTDQRYQIKEELPTVKTSKRILNFNAIRFKLKYLKKGTIRYEVIYKNLIRHMRRHYSKDFNLTTDYIKRKRNGSEEEFTRKIESYILTRLGSDTLEKVGV